MKERTGSKDSNRIDALFHDLRDKGGKALITFITAGDPDLDATRDLILEMERNGADIIELGIPFSDPMADGPTIQASSERALKKGTTPRDVLKTVKEARERGSVAPIVLFGYYNPVFRYGLRRFARDAKAAGADGVLVVDLPPEESGELKAELDAFGLDLIFLLTPTSDPGRMRLVSARGKGFIYFVSLTGVTGARESLSRKIPSYVRKVRKYTGLPVGVGFGISTPRQAREVSLSSDAVIVGSAIINVISENSDDRGRLLREVGSFVKSLKDALRGC